ncbi:MAG: DUF6702 family protein [Verrucomicrobiota bacterium]
MHRFLMCLLLLALSCAGLQAHPVHQSRAEVEYNAARQTLEISLTVFLNDLELALSQQTGETITLEKMEAKAFDAQVQIYLTRTFVVKNAVGDSMAHTLLGHELTSGDGKGGDPELTLFFEIPLPGGLAGCTLRPAVLSEVFPNQTNLIRLQGGLKKTIWCYLPGEAAKMLVGE